MENPSVIDIFWSLYLCHIAARIADRIDIINHLRHSYQRLRLQFELFLSTSTKQSAWVRGYPHLVSIGSTYDNDESSRCDVCVCSNSPLPLSVQHIQMIHSNVTSSTRDGTTHLNWCWYLSLTSMATNQKSGQIRRLRSLHDCRVYSRRAVSVTTERKRNWVNWWGRSDKRKKLNWNLFGCEALDAILRRRPRLSRSPAHTWRWSLPISIYFDRMLSCEQATPTTHFLSGRKIQIQETGKYLRRNCYLMKTLLSA